MPRFSIALVLAALTTPAFAQDGADPQPLELFNQRIMPIFRSDHPSSCVQCHLSAVDLKNYILPSQEQTFVSLRDQGLVDMEHPAESKILTLIQMGDKDLDEGAKLIHESTRRAEYAAFAAWIEACCSDPAIRDLPPLDAGPVAGPERPNEVIRHARRSRVVDSFARNVWSQRMRCFPCHTPHEINPDDPKQAAAVKTLNEFTARFDEDLLARLQIFRETPEATLDYLVEASRATAGGDIPLLNLDEPTRSLLVLKPTSKLPPKKDDGTLPIPTRHEPLYHLGGLKMFPDDQSYKSFVAWIQDYANVVHNRYTSPADLPADNWYASQLVLRLMSVPDDLPELLPVQLFLHARDESTGGWSPQPVAFTQGLVTPNRIVNGALFLFGTPDANANAPDPEHATLPRGDYLVKVYADTHHRLADDPTLLLGEEDLYGQVELKHARWREGFRSAERVSAGDLE
jgi:hypothetical protein